MTYLLAAVFIIGGYSTAALHAVIPQNVFLSYNVLMVPYMPPQDDYQFFAALETCAHTRGFAGDDHTGLTDADPCQVNVLHTFGRTQNAFAVLEGMTSDTKFGQLAQQYSWDGASESFGMYCPEGKIVCPFNVPMSFRMRLPYGLVFGAYTHFMDVSLVDVKWNSLSPQYSYEQILSDKLLQEVAALSGISLGGWHRQGMGDLLTRVELYRTYPQYKPWLQMVGIAMRAGVLWPTDLKSDPDLLFAPSFGNDGGMGMHVSGMLQLCYAHGVILGVDAELLHLFGNTQCRRVKTSPLQTGLLLPVKAPVFREPGFIQRVTLFMEKVQKGGGFGCTFAYLYAKRDDDTFYPCVEGLDFGLINASEGLYDSSAHSLACVLSYDWAYRRDMKQVPSISLIGKWGFNGKRSVVADSVTVTFSIAF